MYVEKGLTRNIVETGHDSTMRELSSDRIPKGLACQYPVFIAIEDVCANVRTVLSSLLHWRTIGNPDQTGTEQRVNRPAGDPCWACCWVIIYLVAERVRMVNDRGFDIRRQEDTRQLVVERKDIIPKERIVPISGKRTVSVCDEPRIPASDDRTLITSRVPSAPAI